MFKKLKFLDLLLGMTEKEFKVRYKRTVFGFLWVLINPILQMLVIGFVFRYFIKDPIPNYFLYLIVGLLVWNFFTLSFQKATSSIVNERALIKKANFPREVIPLSIILANFLNLLISFALLLPLLIYFRTLSVLSLIKLIPAVFVLLIFTSGISLLTSALNVKYRDVTFFVQAFSMVWFYITPIIYTINFIPSSIMWIWRLNPMTSIIQLFQYTLVSAAPPGPAMLTENLLIIIAVTLMGINVFRKESSNFDDWL